MFKTNSEIIKIEARSQAEIGTGVTFWSHDRGTAKLIFKLIKDGVPQSIPEGTSVPIRLIFKSKTTQDGFGKHDYLATVEDRINGIVSIVLEDNILGYIGEVKGSIYLDLPGNRSLDTAGRFNFSIQRSPIDESTPELEDYYFNGFSQTIDKVEKIIADANKEIDTKLTDTNSKITKANNDLTTLNTNLNKAQAQIDALGTLKRVYSNSIDFGDYDYSGNPNLMPYITDQWADSLLANGNTVKDSFKRIITHTKTRAADTGDILSLGLGIQRTGESDNRYLINSLQPSTSYTLSVTMSVGSDWTGETNNIGARVRYLNDSGGTEVPITGLLSANVERDKMITHTFTGTTKANLTGMKNCYIQIFSVNSEDKGTVSVSYDVKLEIGTTATSYQPNLLDAPYYFSKTPLGENIASKTVEFPIKSSVYNVYTGDMEEDLMIGQTYTITLKGTKPAAQTFIAFNRWEINLGTLKPVEGLIDVWSLTFTPTKIDPNFPKNLRIYQYPEATIGACQIDWIKIEKGGMRTPNILCYKYRGVNNFASKNPKDYIWDINNDYAQQIFDDTVSLTKPQTIISAKNFEEAPTVKNQPIHYGPQLFEGWYGSGAEHAGIGTKARLRVGGLVVDGRDQLSEPFTWNSGRYEAAVNRDITFYCKGTMFVEMGGNIGKYIYIANWKNSEQTQYASGMPAGAGTNLDGGLYYRNMLDFSWIVQLKQGDKFSIGIELADGKTVSKIQIRTLHIKELVPPTN